jgi:GDP-4-dehydro-6-deoxy-D-mannose reductase
MKVGNLNVSRDYLDVRDVVSAYIGILESGREGEVYNVSRGEGYLIGDLLEMLLGLSESRIEVVQDSKRMRKTDIEQLVGDPSKLISDTGWESSIGIRETLRDLLDFWRNRCRQQPQS